LTLRMADDPITKLRCAGKKLDLALRMELFAIGADLVPRLIDVLSDAGARWARLHALDILVDLRAMDALVPILRADCKGGDDSDYEFDDRLGLHISRRVPEMGTALLQPILAFIDEHGDELGALYRACTLLLHLEIRDPRIFNAIQRAFEGDAAIGAEMFLQYGDPRGRDLIERAITDFEPDFEHAWGRATVADLVHSYERMGGTLAPELRERNDRWYAEWDSRPEKPYEPWEPEQLARFAQAIIEDSGHTVSTDDAFEVAKIIWTLVGCSDEIIDLRLRLMVAPGDQAGRRAQVAAGRALLEKHRAMFPELHRRRS
jgi:hypothetical protein